MQPGGGLVSPQQQFWWNWWVYAVVAFATFLAVFAALFGDWFKATVLPPRLTMRLREKAGEKTELTDRTTGQKIDDVRYFHLVVENERRWSPAKGVQVFLTGIEEFGPDGQPRVDWLGNVPMRWRDQEVVPLAQTVGAAKDADFLMVQRTEAKVSLMPLLVPNNLRAQRTGGCRFVARLQARSEQVDSDVLRIQVAWDGVWEDGDAEMQGHLVVGSADS
jgi:hypothetical protein